MNTQTLQILDDQHILYKTTTLQDPLSPEECFAWCQTQASELFQMDADALYVDYIHLAPIEHAAHHILFCAIKRSQVHHQNSKVITPWFAILINTVRCEGAHDLFIYHQSGLLYVWAIKNNTLSTAHCIPTFDPNHDAMQLINSYKTHNTNTIDHINVLSHDPLTWANADISIRHTPLRFTPFPIPDYENAYCHINLQPWRQQQQKRRYLFQGIGTGIATLVCISAAWITQVHIEQHNQHLQNKIVQLEKDTQITQKNIPRIHTEWQATQKRIEQWNRITQQHIVIHALLSQKTPCQRTRIHYTKKQWTYEGQCHQIANIKQLKDALLKRIPENKVRIIHITRQESGHYAFSLTNTQPKKTL